jgi:hypothetical protein
VLGQVMLLAQQHPQAAPAASRAMPAPLMPPPTTKRSYSSVIRRFSVLAVWVPG